MMQNKW